MKCRIKEPQKLIDFIEGYLAYENLVTHTMYNLKNTPILNAKIITDAIAPLLEKEFMCEDKTLRFFDIRETNTKIGVSTHTPTEIKTKDITINFSEGNNEGSIFYGNVKFNFTQNLTFNHTFFNETARVEINNRILTREELKCISGNIFDLCDIDETIGLTTAFPATISQIYQHMEDQSSLRDLVRQQYQEGLDGIKEWGYNQAAYVPELKKCLSPQQRKIFTFDVSNINETLASCEGIFSNSSTHDEL